MMGTLRRLVLTALIACGGLWLVVATSGAGQAPPTDFQLRLISSDSGQCLLAEVVISDRLIGHALVARDGPLSQLASGQYPVIAQYYPPDLLLLHRPDGSGPDVRIGVTTAKTASAADALSAQYAAKGGKGVPYDVILGSAADPRKCAVQISEVQLQGGKPDILRTDLYDVLFAGLKPSPVSGSFTRSIVLNVERPVAVEFRQGNHLFRRTGTTWVETLDDKVVATYDETDRNLINTSLVDRVQETVQTPFGPAKVWRIVTAPHGFLNTVYLNGKEQKSFMLRRDAGDVAMLSGPRVDLANPWQTKEIVTKSFIRRIVVDSIVDGQPIPPATNLRLGFADMVGGRADALAFALLTDKTFSELPMSDSSSSADFRLLSRLTVQAECSGDVIRNYDPPGLVSEFGREGPLSAEGKVSVPPQVTERRNANGSLAGLHLSYEITGRPNALTLPAFNLVRPRSCSWIWHRVDIDLQCSAGKLAATAATSGSGFPARRLWVDHALIGDIDQGPFDRLWMCDAADPSRVR